MTRKIKGKKHRGVKDPYEQMQRRLDKKKADQAPVDIDTQEIPKKLQLMMKHMNKQKNPSKNRMVDGKPKKKNKNDNSRHQSKNQQQGKTQGGFKPPKVKQGKNESDAQFTRRINKMSVDLLNEAKLETKYKVDVVRNKQGEITKMTPWEKTDPLMSDKKAARLEKSKERKKQKKKEWKEKKKMKQKKDTQEDDEFYVKDKVEFGEVVHQPPSLDTQKISKKMNEEASQGQKFIFLDKLKSKKGEEVSVARKRQLEAERERAVQAYRDMKTLKKHKVSAL